MIRHLALNCVFVILTFGLASCVTAPVQDVSVPLSAESAYVAQFVHKWGHNDYERCVVIGMLDENRTVDCTRVRRGDVIYTIIPAASKELILRVSTSRPNAQRAPGEAKIRLHVELKGGMAYKFELTRKEQVITMRLVESESGNPVTDFMVFNVANPFMIPIPIPL